MDAAFAEDPDAIGPLHRMPVIVKDNYNTKSVPSTGASLSLEGMQPKTDAFTVAQLRDAGALMLANSNLIELAMGGTTISSLGGQTRNPSERPRFPGQTRLLRVDPGAAVV